MKYSLRSLMIAVLVLPPLLAWGGMPIYRWPTAPAPAPGTVRICMDDFGEAIAPYDPMPNSSAPAPKPPKP